MMQAPLTAAFQSVTVILPVTTETLSLKKTVQVILHDCRSELKEFLIVVCGRTKPESMAVVEEIKAQLAELVVVHQQRLPFLGGAMREAFDLARGSHAIMMASDLETDPQDVRLMVAEAKRQPNAIITASRWRRSGGFSGYDRFKLAANWLFQRFFSLLYRTRLSDLTYGYRLFPTALIQAIRWEELHHAFLFETLVKPLRLGVAVIEIPTTWTARTEGESQNTFMRNFVYFRTGLKTRFAPRHTLLKTSADPGAPSRR